MSQNSSKAKFKENNIPWCEKYRPISTKTMVGFEDVSQKLRNFLEKFFKIQKKIKKLKSQLKNKDIESGTKHKLFIKLKSYQSKLKNRKASLLLGPPGIGKTTVVYALANDYNLTVIELNASDVRTQDALNEKLGETVKSTNLLSFTKKKVKGKLILIDEVDGIHGRSDRGGVPALVKIIYSSKYPIIMTCNYYDRKFKKLYDLSSPMINVHNGNTNNLVRVLEEILKSEDITLTKEQLKKIANNANGDYRSAINDLQGVAQGVSSLDEDLFSNISIKRDTEAEVQEFMKKLFLSKSIREAKRSLDEIQGKNIDFHNVHRWINENLLKFISNKFDLKFAYENLSHADKILGYIGRTQDYKHLSYYFDILGGGIMLSKTDKKMYNRRLRYPRWFRLRAASDDEVALGIQKLYRSSLNNIMREIKPNLKLFLKYNKGLNEYLSRVFKVEPKQIKKNIK